MKTFRKRRRCQFGSTERDDLQVFDFNLLNYRPLSSLPSIFRQSWWREKTTHFKVISPCLMLYISSFFSVTTEVVIYFRKQESKKTRKHAFDQESYQEKKRDNGQARPRRRLRKKEKKIFFLVRFLDPARINGHSVCTA